MNDPAKPKPYTVGSDEKESTLFIYTQGYLARGTVLTKQAIRVSTWLRTQAAPEYIRVYNAQILQLAVSGPIQSVNLQEIFIPSIQVLSFHLAPPAADPPDYDPSEPNRKMEPVTILVGSFRFNGCIRITSQNKLFNYMETAREAFFSLYDVEITNPIIPGMGMLKIPFALIRTNGVVIAAR